MKNTLKVLVLVLLTVLGFGLCAAAEEVEEIEVSAEEVVEVVEITEDTAEEITEEKSIALRAAADGMSEIVATVSEDASLEILSREGDWLLVSAEGKNGYMFCPVAAPAARLDVFTSRTSNIAMGSGIVLTSKLTGLPEGCTVSYQWQCDCGNGFSDIEGATSSTYSYSASMESLACAYRLVVTVKEA